MSDKYLTTKNWQTFAKGRRYKDLPLVKALDAVESAAKGPAAGQLEALDGLETAATALLGQNKADEAATAYLQDVLKALKKERKDAEKAAKEEEDADAADTKGNALLDPKKLRDQLMNCQRKPDFSVQFAYIDGKEKAPGTVAMHPRISGAKLFALLREQTGVKTGAYGTAWVEGTELMLQLDKPMGGLVNKMRQPIKACGFRPTKIKLFSEDGTVFEEDDGSEPTGDGQATPGAEPATVAPGGPTGKAVQPAVALESAALDKQLLDLVSGISKQGGAKELQLAKLLASEARVFHRNLDHGGVSANLEKLKKLLARPPQAAPQDGQTDAPGRQGGKVSTTVAFTQTRLAWDTTRNLVREKLRGLEQAILADTKGRPDRAEIVANLHRLYEPLEELDEDLLIVLDDALNAKEPAQRQAHHQEAIGEVDRYLAYVNSDGDALFAKIDDNGDLAEMGLRKLLRERLQNMRKLLEAAVAA